MLKDLCLEGHDGERLIISESITDKERDTLRYVMTGLHVNHMLTKYIKVKAETSLIVGAYPMSDLANWSSGAQQILDLLPEIKSVNIIAFNENTKRYIGGCRVERGTANE